MFILNFYKVVYILFLFINFYNIEYDFYVKLQANYDVKHILI